MTTVLTEPPEAVLCGESVPLENQQDDLDELHIKRTMNLLKTRGEPFTSMSETELRERAVELLRKYGGDA